MKKITLLVSAMALTAGIALAHGGGNGQGMQGNHGMMNNQGSYQANQNFTNEQCPGMRDNGSIMHDNRGYGKHGKNRGHGMMQCFQNTQTEPLTEEQALGSVTNVINTEFNGYEITKVTKFQMPMGLIYSVNVKTADGKDAIFRVTPHGKVVGPFIAVK